MSHIHLPDGVLPIWLWVLGYLIVGFYILFISSHSRQIIMNKKFALVGVMAAIMIIAMSIEIIPPAYHMNLAVLTGIVLGPVLSVIAILVNNVILALLGHGGVSVIGLNTIVVSIEAIFGYWGFKFLYSRFKNVFTATFIAAFIALFISAWASIGVIYLGTKSFSEVFHSHDHSHTEIVVTGNEHTDVSPHEFAGSIAEQVEINPTRLILAVLTLGILGWIVEAIVTAFMVSYIQKIKPDVLERVTYTSS